MSHIVASRSNQSEERTEEEVSYWNKICHHCTTNVRTIRQAVHLICINPTPDRQLHLWSVGVSCRGNPSPSLQSLSCCWRWFCSAWWPGGSPEPPQICSPKTQRRERQKGREGVHLLCRWRVPFSVMFHEFVHEFLRILNFSKPGQSSMHENNMKWPLPLLSSFLGRSSSAASRILYADFWAAYQQIVLPKCIERKHISALFSWVWHRT